MNILYSFKCIYCIVQMQMFALSRKPKDWRYTEHFTIPRLSVDLLRVLQNRSKFTVAIVYIVQCAVANVYIILYSCKCLHYLANQKIGGTRSTFAISQRTEHENSGRHWWCCKWKLWCYDMVLLWINFWLELNFIFFRYWILILKIIWVLIIMSILGVPGSANDLINLFSRNLVFTLRGIFFYPRGWINSLSVPAG